MKSINKRSKITGPVDDKVVISSEYYKDDRPSFICSVCNCTLTKLTDSSGQNPAFYCTRCNIQYDPENENLRRESRLTVPDRNEDPLVAQTPGQEYLNKKVEINHTPEIKGGLKALKERGLKITYYEEHIPK